MRHAWIGLRSRHLLARSIRVVNLQADGPLACKMQHRMSDEGLLVELPTELQALILNLLDMPDKINAASCCKSLRDEATRSSLTSLHIVPSDFVHLSSYSTRSSRGETQQLAPKRDPKARGQRLATGTTVAPPAPSPAAATSSSPSALPWPPLPADFPRLFRRFPCVKELKLEVDARRPEFRVGRIDAMLEALMQQQQFMPSSSSSSLAPPSSCGAAGGGGSGCPLVTLRVTFKTGHGRYGGADGTMVRGLLKGLARCTAAGGLSSLTTLHVELDAWTPHR